VIAVQIAVFILIAAGVWLGTSLPAQLQESVRHFQSRSEGGIEETISRFRLPLLQAGWEIWSVNPLLGTGPGKYDDRVDEYLENIRHTEGASRRYSFLKKYLTAHSHSLYLQLAIDFGIVGLLAYLYFFSRLGCDLSNRATQSRWALAGLTALVGFLIHNLFDVTFPSLSIETGLLLGLSLSTQAR
jgi:O-antigen ligase